MATKRKPGITKAKGYLNRIFTVEYDLEGMIKAYGPEFMHFLIDEITSGNTTAKYEVDRWVQHIQKHGRTGFDTVSHRYGRAANIDLMDTAG